jgi:hypothetical protein
MTYTLRTPTTSTLDPRIVPFFETFYAVSDNPSAHQEYVDSFTPSAKFIMGTKSTSGTNGIMELRKGLWSGPVITRKHHVEKLFVFDGQGRQCMLHGCVDYVLRNGKSVNVEWAGRATLVEHEGRLRFQEYQVYLASLLLISELDGEGRATARSKAC